MKHCPTCNRTYADDSTTFCLADGSLLSAPYDPDATQRIPLHLTNPSPTQVLTTSPPPTQVLPYHPSPAYPVRQNNRAKLSLVIVLLALLVGGGIIALVKFNQKASSTNSGVLSSKASEKSVESKAPTDYIQSPWLGLEIGQGGKPSGMFKVDLRRTRVSLSREPFEIRVPRLKDDPPVLVTAWTSDKIFDQIKEGEKLSGESSSYFNPYKTMADTRAGSATLMLDDDAHSAYDEDRLKPISESQSTIFISSIDEHSLKDQKDNLYLVIFRDLNHNETVDNGEYEFLILDFKQ
ncbi:MAG TPA: hypothetical protein VGN95_20565 [Pyrinomonadaceae bacterium]|nr:hypothetical protein [Pyrinomonadaceae bacterium]